jgi:hypothetical protein
VADGLTVTAVHRTRRAARWEARYRLVPWWLRITVVYIAARFVTGWIMMGFARVEPSNSFTLASPHYLAFASIWDGAWYRAIALGGYPSTLPVDSAGNVAQNAWAFMPAYPYLVRGLMTVTGTSFELVAIVVSLLFGWGAALLFRSLLGRFLPAGTATFAAVLFCVAPVSIMFQVAYAESMGLLLLVLALWLLVRQRFWLMLPVIVVLGMTRPTGLAFALFMVLYLVVRFVRPSALSTSATAVDTGTVWRDGAGVQERLAFRRFVPPAVVAVVSGLVGLAWPAIAWLVTGVPKAYTETELAWRADYIGRKPLTPFAPWVQGFSWWFHEPAGGILLVVVLVGFAAFLLMPPARRIGVELRLWVVAYFVYLLAVFFPQSSTWRILLPIFPLLGIVALPRFRSYRIALVIVSVLLQWVWMYYCWWINGYDWTPP